MLPPLPLILPARAEAFSPPLSLTLPLLTIFQLSGHICGGRRPDGAGVRQGLLLFTPPWVCYVLVVMLGTGRLGLTRSLVLGVVVFVLLSLLMQKALDGTKLPI